MTLYNKYFPIWIKGDDNILSTYTDKVSLRNDGRSELRGDTYITNGGRLMINKDKNSTTTYYLDVNGDVNFNSNSLYVKYIRYLGGFFIGNITGTNSMTSLTIGSQNPYAETCLSDSYA